MLNKEMSYWQKRERWEEDGRWSVSLCLKRLSACGTHKGRRAGINGPSACAPFVRRANRTFGKRGATCRAARSDERPEAFCLNTMIDQQEVRK